MNIRDNLRHHLKVDIHQVILVCFVEETKTQEELDSLELSVRAHIAYSQATLELGEMKQFAAEIEESTALLAGEVVKAKQELSDLNQALEAANAMVGTTEIDDFLGPSTVNLVIGN